MAAASSSFSSSVPRWKYDVFINFRGEDTHRGFVSHLYKALYQKAINTYIDAEELRKGNDLSQLLTAIRDSSVSIVVFFSKLRIFHMVLEGARPNTGLYACKEPDGGARFLPSGSFSCLENEEAFRGSFCRA
ncbi:hypothetical protein DVH24_022645 [Malus domestica]|uniref:ADP-ribosyl cyclase/cyclic ADP-ribose hydrolase n=1 Tax=Malus domestica TaxID=3750 RepID=A0A498KMX4_MALDO|nr:hypothetical protein DVH24_022645 [Malus domestica]